MSTTANTYMTLGLGFHRPDETSLKLLRQSETFSEILKDARLEELQHEYTRLFSLSVAGGVVPCETEYGPKEIFRKTQQLADISGFYRAFGMEVGEQAHQRVDFIGAELEWMGWIMLKERHAEDQDKEEKAAICRDAAKKFMDAHLGRWAALFAERLTKESQHPFYTALGKSLADWIAVECERLGVQPEKIGSSKPQPAPDWNCEKGACGA